MNEIPGCSSIEHLKCICIFLQRTKTHHKPQPVIIFKLLVPNIHYRLLEYHGAIDFGNSWNNIPNMPNLYY